MLFHEIKTLFLGMLEHCFIQCTLLNQEAFKSSPNHNTQSPEVTSKAVIITEDFNNGSSNEDMSDGVKSLKEKLSAALVNVSAKEDLVKQHAKVAEEAVAGIAYIHIHDTRGCICYFLLLHSAITVQVVAARKLEWISIH